ncbi:hypothetical protein VTP01DRAFT_1664 [Rhizomucor pusillus]|uniref:uncharacterized protein n=1 Tax=Rhizomucor pusillus TaxID=4840 RepID=UPI003742FBED
MPNLKLRLRNPRKMAKAARYSDNSDTTDPVACIPNDLKILCPAVNSKPGISMEPGTSMADINPALGETRESVLARCTIQGVLLITYKIGLEFQSSLSILTVNMSNQSVTYSKARFPNGDYEEVAKAKFDQSKNAYVDFSLDIGWAVRGEYSSCYSKPKPEIRRYKRKCCGHIVCENDNCNLKNQQLRPCGDKKALEKQLEKSCATCGFRFAHYECPVEAFFRFSGEQCVLQHKGIHSHNIDDAVRSTHNLRAKAATVGINPKTGQVMPSLLEINPGRVGGHYGQWLEPGYPPLDSRKDITSLNVFFYDTRRALATASESYLVIRLQADIQLPLYIVVSKCVIVYDEPGTRRSLNEIFPINSRPTHALFLSGDRIPPVRISKDPFILNVDSKKRADLIRKSTPLTLKGYLKRGTLG